LFKLCPLIYVIFISDSVDGKHEASLANHDKSAPPLPRKKSFHLISSKKEKDEENMSAKNRTKSVTELRSNHSFEKLPTFQNETAEKLPEKSHTLEKMLVSKREEVIGRESIVSRSLSLPSGPNPGYRPAIPNAGKLKIAKLITSTPRAPVQRSKSLKINKQPTLVTLAQFNSSDDLALEQLPKRKWKSYSNQAENTQVLKSDIRVNLATSSTPRPAPSSKRIEENTHVVRRESMRATTSSSVYSIASGLGIRERRSSFRKAVIKQDSEDLVTTVLVEKSPVLSSLTVRSENGNILKPEKSSKSIANSVERSHVNSSKSVVDAVDRSHINSSKLLSNPVERSPVSSSKSVVHLVERSHEKLSKSSVNSLEKSPEKLSKSLMNSGERSPAVNLNGNHHKLSRSLDLRTRHRQQDGSSDSSSSSGARELYGVIRSAYGK